MNSTKQHKKVRLSGNDDCSVVLCSEFNVLELSFGSSTVHVIPESLQTISTILNNANVRLTQRQNPDSLYDNHQPESRKRIH